MSEFSSDSESDYEDEDESAPHAVRFDEAKTVISPKIQSTLKLNTASMDIYLKLSKGVVIQKN